MNRYVFDIETDNLLSELTKIHCATFYNIDTKETTIFRPSDVSGISRILDNCELLIGHNILEFDIPAIKKVLNYDYKGEVFDTLLGSRILFPDMDYESYEEEYEEKELVNEYFTEDDEHIKEYELVKKIRHKKAKSRHGLENWGIKLGIAKPQYDQWDEYTEEMLHRNIEDVKITTKLYEFIQETMQNYTKNDKRLQNWTNIFKMEHKFWQIAIEQAKTGWLFNVNSAFDVEKELEDTVGTISAALQDVLPLNVLRPYKDGVCKGLKQNGIPTSHALSWVGIENEDKIGGDFCRVKYETTNLDSPEQLKTWLYSFGWKPTEWNYKKDRHGKPVRDDKGKMILKSPKLPKTSEDWTGVEQELKIPHVAMLAERQKAAHRLSSLRGMIQKLRPDQRLSAEMNTCGTNTRRCMHRTVVNVPKADPNVYYGEQFRSLFICPYDKILVGADCSGLEARAESHYLYQFDKAAAYELLHGDVHTRNAEEVFKTTRNVAKNGKYALLYGCSPYKLATVIGKSVEESKHIYDEYWKANPGLKNLVSALERQWEKNGYLVSIDGAPLTVRYKHALLNTLLQSCGSIIVKMATCILDSRIANEELNVKFVGHMHDEWVLECEPFIAEYVGKLSIESMKKSGEWFKMNAPITGEFRIGKSWKDIH